MKSFNLSEWALEHRSFVWFLMLISVLAGFLAYERLGRRLGICVADHDQATIGGVTPSATWWIWSDDRAVALLAAKHVRHDIALQLTCERLAAAGLEDFWVNDPNLEALRDASAAAMAAWPAAAG